MDKTRDCGIDIWGKLDTTYRNQLTRAVRDALTQLRDGGLDSLIIQKDGSQIAINIYDANGQINQQTLQAIKLRINQAQDEVSLSQASLL